MAGKKPIKKISKDQSDSKAKTFSEEVAPNLDPKARSMCIKCRGVKKLCGKSKCPVLVKFYSQVKDEKKEKFKTKEIDGSSPPSVFIGRHQYPKVNVGPLIPPEKGDTSIYSKPEKWYGEKNIQDIVNLRGSLARGKKRLKTGIQVNNKLSREIEEIRYMTLSKRPQDAEVEFKKKLSDTISFDGKSQPHGPSARMKKLTTENETADKRLEKVFYDDDLKSRDAVTKLYQKGVPVSKIQDVFMVGGTGIDKNRKFVPTRWAITGVDSILSKDLRNDVKKFRRINNYRIYETTYLDNKWLIIFTPETWRYESIEAFYPETTWNPSSDSIAIFGDNEEYDGRDDYASIGGCYYAARLAVLEKLYNERRQAGVIILREAKPGYILPVGVWNVRESVRNALRNEPSTCETKKEVIQQVDERTDLSLKQWLSVSKMLKTKRNQKKLFDF